jgi:hypothetical protein
LLGHGGGEAHAFTLGHHLFRQAKPVAARIRDERWSRRARSSSARRLAKAWVRGTATSHDHAFGGKSVVYQVVLPRDWRPHKGQFEAAVTQPDDVIETRLTQVGSRFSETERTDAEIAAYANAMADMVCGYLRLMARPPSPDDVI